MICKRTKCNDKRAALLKATLDLVNNNGFHDAPMSKIAQMAGVSPGTIYLYFRNKQDLINQLYIEVKSSFSRHAFKNYQEDLPVKKGFRIIWDNVADYQLDQVGEGLFLSQCDNTPIIDEESRKEGLRHLKPLLDLWERGQKEGIIKPLSHFILYAYAVHPLAFLMKAQQQNNYHLSKEMLDDAFQSAWDSIRI